MVGNHMRDGYPLEAVLSLRKLERDQRRQELQEAQTWVQDRLRDLDEAREVEHRIRGELEDARQERRSRERQGVRAVDIQAHMRHLAALEHQLDGAVIGVEAASDACGKAARALEAAREGLALAQGELRSVEKHREAWAEQARREQERRAEEDP